jgi:hypothetical protein
LQKLKVAISNVLFIWVYTSQLYLSCKWSSFWNESDPPYYPLQSFQSLTRKQMFRSTTGSICSRLVRPSNTPTEREVQLGFWSLIWLWVWAFGCIFRFIGKGYRCITGWSLAERWTLIRISQMKLLREEQISSLWYFVISVSEVQAFNGTRQVSQVCFYLQTEAGFRFNLNGVTNDPCWLRREHLFNENLFTPPC